MRVPLVWANTKIWEPRTEFRAAWLRALERLSSGLVVAQLTMSFVLLVCAELFVRSGQQAVALDLGFRTDQLLLVSVDPLAQGYGQGQARTFYRAVASDVTALPGVRSVSWARRAPLAAGAWNMRAVTLDGGAVPETNPVNLDLNYVDPAFFDTVAVPVIRGRRFSDEEASDGRDLAVISETAARRFWPDQDPLGKRFFDVSVPERQF